MHILCSVSEYDANVSALEKLPVGTTVVVQGITGKGLRRMLLTDSGFILEEDFVERDRGWSSEAEEEAFVGAQTRESAIQFYVDHDEWEGPRHAQREYSAMSRVEREHLTNVRHSGCYVGEWENGEKPKYTYNLFYVQIEKGDDLAKVEEEVMLVLDAQQKRHPDAKEHRFSIFERTLSYGASFYLVFTEKEWRVQACRYGRANVHFAHKKLRKCLEYIHENHWYDSEYTGCEDSDDDY